MKKVKVDTPKSCYLFDCTEEEVGRLFSKIKNKNTMDKYFLSMNDLKLFSNELVKPISIFINKCFNSGYFPDELKFSRVVPVYKRKGDINECNNYRPISILPNMSKIFELAIKNRMVNFLEKYSLLHIGQHGYRKQRSTITALIEIIQNITEALDNGEIMKMLSFDLSKAFDSVSHEILLDKLNFYGFRDVVNDLLRSYLTNRKQHVAFGVFSSSETNVELGVPQGSILGPILFLIYVNDLNVPDCVNTCLYCDDTSVLIKHQRYAKQGEKYQRIY